MKKLLLIVLLAVVGVMNVIPAQAYAPAVMKADGAEVVFPFGTEVPFPWETMEGIWEINEPSLKAYFSFQVQHDKRGVKVLTVLQLDHTTKKIVGQGLGFSNEDQKIVRAIMRSVSGQYLLFVRVFRDLQSQRRSLQNSTVLTIRTFDKKNALDRHFLVQKVSNTPFRMTSGR